MARSSWLRSPPSPRVVLGDRPARQAATAAGVILVCVLAATGAPAAASTPDSAVTAPEPVLCLAIDAARLTATSWTDLVEGLGRLVDERPLVFPDPVIVSTPTSGSDLGADGRADADVRVWASPAPTGTAVGDHPTGCLLPGTGWTAVVTLPLLIGAAERILASAGLPSNVAASISVELVPAELRVRTTLVFTGDFGVGGTCWVDDVLTVDPSTGRAGTCDELHADLHFLAPQDACTRSREFMPYGAAGLLAVGLAPGHLPETTMLDFTTTPVDVQEGGILLAGDVVAH